MQADELRLYGHAMGALSLEGVRDSVRHLWSLNNLRLGDEDARLRGSGLWRLRGPDRGLELNASVQAQNLGAWMDRAGWKDLASKNKLKDNGLAKSLEKLKRVGDDDHDDQAKILEEVVRLVAALKKERDAMKAALKAKR